jgi:hypothetical protein
MSWYPNPNPDLAHLLFFCMGNFVEALKQEMGAAGLLYAGGGG